MTLSRYVRLRAVHPRAANDNRSHGSSRFWHWALAFGAAPTIGLAFIISLMI